ncbi:MAG: hypothetical protein AAGH60_09585 [Pseudomonadota bacterium]
MLLGYVGAVVAGLTLAGIVLAVSKTFKLSPPKWIYPATVGLGMIGLTIYLEYTWFPRTQSELPDEVVVVETFRTQKFYQPWTYLIPQVDRFVAVDTASVRRNEDVEGVVLVDTFLMERTLSALLATQFVDCNQGRRLLADEGLQLSQDRLLEADGWVDLGLTNALVQTACADLLSGDEDAETSRSS